MGKKVLVISTSPRMGGNSERLADEFIRGAVEAGLLGRWGRNLYGWGRERLRGLDQLL